MPSISRNGSPSISMRSAKVPLSPSSALQTTYFWSASTPATVRHLIPVGKPAPPRPRRPESSTSFTVAAGPISSARRKPLAAAVRLVVVERQRVGHAAAGEDQPLLLLQIVDLLDAARAPWRARRRRASRQHARVLGRRAGRSRSGRRRARLRPAAPASRGPREPVRTISTSTPARVASAKARATFSAPSASAVEVRGDVDRASSAASPPASASRLSRVSRADRLAVEHRGRRGGAMAEAIDRLDADTPPPSCASATRPWRSSRWATRSSQPAAWQDSARQSFSTAPSSGRAAEIVIETDDADRLRLRDVERGGDQRDRGVVDVAEALLQIVQDRQHRARLVLARVDERLAFRLAPMHTARHRVASWPPAPSRERPQSMPSSLRQT